MKTPTDGDIHHCAPHANLVTVAPAHVEVRGDWAGWWIMDNRRDQPRSMEVAFCPFCGVELAGTKAG